jgi:uncharacterized protein YciI
MYYLLLYDYAANAIERRAPFREAHLALAREWVQRGSLLLGGAFADPLDGAVLVFKVDGREDVEEFVRKDPYVAGGLVTNWRIRPWTVVVGSALEAREAGGEP